MIVTKFGPDTNVTKKYTSKFLFIYEVKLFNNIYE